MGRFTGLLGIAVILAVAWLLSKHKRAIKLRILFWGLGLQFGFAFIVLRTGFSKVFQAASAAVTAMLGYAEVGSAFVFGDTLGKSSGSMGSVFRVPGAADHHFHRVVFFDPLLSRRHAGGREGLCRS